MECFIANPWSSFASEEERFESTDEKRGLIPLPCRGMERLPDMSHEHHSGLNRQCGRAVVALSTFT